MNINLRPRRTRARAGYSLMEMLIAIGVFTVGFAGVAAIFPAAVALQKNSADAMLAEIAQNNAKAIATSTNKLTFTYTPGAPGTTTGDLGAGNYFDATGTLIATPTVAAPTTVQNKWSADLRSYPSSRSDPLQRDLYWIPLIRSSSGDPTSPKWQLFIFVLRRQSAGDYQAPSTWPTDWNSGDYISDSKTVGGTPGIVTVNATPDAANAQKYLVSNNDSRCRLRPGDWVVSQNTGTIFRVVTATTTYVTVNGTITASGSDKLWVGMPPANFDKNPTQAVFVLTDGSYVGP